MTLSPKHREALMSVIPSVVAGSAAALQSQVDQDPIGSAVLKTVLAGSGGALAGKYLTPLLRQGAAQVGGSVMDAGRSVRDAVKGMEGQGILSAAVGLPAAGLVGAGAYQLGRAINAPMDAAGIGGFQSQESLANQAMNEYLNAVQGMQSTAINPEAYGISSNTDLALLNMV